MSLTSPKLIVPFMVLALAAVTIVSCSQQNSPSAPSSITVSTAVQPAATEYWVTLFDETDPTFDETDPTAPAPPPPPPPPGSGPVPWPPGPPPMAVSGMPVPTPPSTHPRVTIKIDPEPVRHSGQPTGTSSCRDLRHTWFYDQHLHGETGIVVTFAERENFFDGRFVNRNTESIRLVVHRPVILHTRWCSGYAKPHYTQTRFKGKADDNEVVVVSGPWVRLLTPR